MRDARGRMLWLEIDELGFDEMDRRLLETIIDKFDGGPVGVDNLAAAIGEERGTIEDVLEPYLIQQGLLMRTPRGRVATRLAYEHLGFTPPRGGPAAAGGAGRLALEPAAAARGPAVRIMTADGIDISSLLFMASPPQAIGGGVRIGPLQADEYIISVGSDAGQLQGRVSVNESDEAREERLRQLRSLGYLGD
mgnify:CR=1 FL=1